MKTLNISDTTRVSIVYPPKVEHSKEILFKKYLSEYGNIFENSPPILIELQNPKDAIENEPFLDNLPIIFLSGTYCAIADLGTVELYSSYLDNYHKYSCTFV